MQLLLVFVVIIAVANSFRHNHVRRYLKTSVNLFGNEPPKSNAPAPAKDQGLFGGMGNMMEQMKKVQEIQKQAEIIQKELQETIITGSDPSGQAFSTFNGLSQPISVKIQESLLSQGAEAVSLAATQALVDAHQKSTQTMLTRMQAMYAKAGVPPPPLK